MANRLSETSNDFGSKETGTLEIDSEQRIEFLADLLRVPTGHAIVGVDPRGTIVLWSAGSRALYGWEPEEVLGIANIAIVFDPHDVAIDRHMGILSYAETHGAWEGILGRVKKDGTKFHARVSVAPRWGPAGDLVGFLLVGTDISSELELTEELRRNEETLKLAIEASKGGVFDWDIKKDVSYRSAETAQMFGVGDLVYPNATEQWAKSIHPEDVAATVKARNDALVSGHVDAEFRIVRPSDGAIRTLAIRANTHYDEEGHPTRMTGLYWDVTERKLQTQAMQLAMDTLQQVNQELETFAQVASHDLQEPLRTMSSFCQLLEKRYADKLDQDGKEFIGFIVEGAARMQALVNDLLEYSKVGRSDQAFVPVDVSAVLERATGGLRTAIGESGAELECGPMPVVRGSEIDLQRLFQNLISNALKFRDPERPPRVSIEALPAGKNWHFIVQDNGIGIEAEYFERIFRVFQRLQNRTEYPGTGMGLAICKKIVERHGGKIWLESEPGKGSRFHFVLKGSGGTA
jgi:PAS domain S-box-containing protein